MNTIFVQIIYKLKLFTNRNHLQMAIIDMLMSKIRTQYAKSAKSMIDPCY